MAIISVTVPDSLKEFAEQQVAEGCYPTTSDYLGQKQKAQRKG